jgi:hypothetical protein
MPVNLDKLRRAANCHKVQKWLVHYFIQKVGRENMHRIVDPSNLMDLTIHIPPLHTRIEIVPNARDLRLQDDHISLEWNLFVLGTKRMFLGRTAHQDIMATLHCVRNVDQVNRVHGIEYGVNPKQIIAFIIRVLGKHEEGYVPWIAPQRSIDQILNFGTLGVGYNHGGGLPSDIYR